MNPRELQIGNYVNPYDDFITQVTGITNTGKIWLVDNPTHEECAWKKDKIKPVLLTEEWLVKFGFEKDGHNFKMKGYTFNLKTGNLWWHNKNLISLKSITFVHQLQNLYFALTGEELTIK